jgi:hypothetical protein
LQDVPVAGETTDDPPIRFCFTNHPVWVNFAATNPVVVNHPFSIAGASDQPKTIQRMKTSLMTASWRPPLPLPPPPPRFLLTPTRFTCPWRLRVTLKGDTLRGKVAVGMVNNYVTQISFRGPDGADKVKYGPDDLLAFGQKRPDLLRDFTDLTSIDKEQVHYESKEHPRREGKKVFMERLMDGKKIRVYNNPAGGEKSTELAGFKLSEKETSYVVQRPTPNRSFSKEQLRRGI